MDKVIAIDGPSGSGKSSMAKDLAYKLNALFIDTGSMFRSIGLKAKEDELSFEEGELIQNFLEKLDFQYSPRTGTLIEINGKDYTHLIRSNEVSELASIISQIPSVRSFLLKTQRSLPKKNICVMEGRDIGTVVFPQAFCKVFLTASPEVRAKRRREQLLEGNPNLSISFDSVLQDVLERDRKDTNRSEAPLKQAEDAVYLDTGDMKSEEVLEKLLQIVQDKATKNQIELNKVDI